NFPAQADRLAAGLLRIGLQPGDMLGLCGPNSVEWYITNLAAARAGLVTVNINPAYQTPELEYCLTKARVNALVVPDKFKTQNYPEMVAELVPEITSCIPGKLESKRLPCLKSLIIISDKKFPGAVTYESLMESSTDGDVSRIETLQDLIDPDSPCNMQFTSGTTGQPKGTVLSHHSIVNNAYFTGKRLGFDKKPHRICLPIPMFHGFGNGIGIINALHFGCTLVLPSPTFQAETSINAIEKERCTAIFGTPTMFVDILSKNENPQTFDSLEIALTGGAPTPPHLIQKIVESLSLERCVLALGMTETGPTTFLHLPQDSRERCATTVGKVMDHTEVKVVDRKGDIVPMGQPGELLIRGYCNMLYYGNDEEKTRETIDSSRWLHTGDQIVLHEDGYAQVVGRIKDIIIRGGENIFPKEIEDFLSTHPDILDSQVLGIPDARLGEEVCACVRLNTGSKLTSEELKTFCKGKIAHFKIPKVVKFVSDYPRTQTGKVQKQKLRDIILDEAFN
ncbi:Luciferin 4-monooxygenase, partial [Gryllus bimaculatus]